MALSALVTSSMANISSQGPREVEGLRCLLGIGDKASLVACCICRVVRFSTKGHLLFVFFMKTEIAAAGGGNVPSNGSGTAL